MYPNFYRSSSLFTRPNFNLLLTGGGNFLKRAGKWIISIPLFAEIIGG
jgi:hypothetical protein